LMRQGWVGEQRAGDGSAHLRWCAAAFVLERCHPNGQRRGQRGCSHEFTGRSTIRSTTAAGPSAPGRDCTSNGWWPSTAYTIAGLALPSKA
jgi:hypothetical protein